MKNKSHLLATDLDNTLVGNDAATRDLFLHFRHLPYDVALVYITGRHFYSALQLIKERQLPMPDVLVTDVGTSIYEIPHAKEDVKWCTYLNEDWQPEAILQVASRFPSLVRQSLPHQKRISFYTSSVEVVKEFEQCLKEQQIPHRLIYSSHRDVDVLPVSSGKGQALAYILENYAAPHVKLLIAGDSGNDEAMLSLGYPSVIVGNAGEDLAHMTHPDLYRAKEHYAAGIIEAWTHFYAN